MFFIVSSGGRRAVIADRMNVVKVTFAGADDVDGEICQDHVFTDRATFIRRTRDLP